MGRYSRLDELGLIRATRSFSSQANECTMGMEAGKYVKGLTSLFVQSPFRTSFLSSLKHLSTFSTVAWMSWVLLCAQSTRRFTYDFLLPGFVRKGGVAKTSTALFEAFYLLLYPFDVLETKFVLDDFHVAHGVDVSLHVDDFCIVESADDLEDAVDRTYVR
jgi:hypothetical protein